MAARCVLEIGELRVTSAGMMFHPTEAPPLEVRTGDDVELRVHYVFEETPDARESLHLALNVEVGQATLPPVETAMRDKLLRQDRTEGTIASFAKFATPGRVRAHYRLEADAVAGRGKRARHFAELGEIEFQVKPAFQTL